MHNHPVVPFLIAGSLVAILAFLFTIDSPSRYQNPFDIIESQTEISSTNPFTSLR